MNAIEFNSTLDLKIKLNFNKTKMLRLYSDLWLMMNYQRDLKYCMINMKIDKAYRAIDNIMKKDCSLHII